jgi:hypothetical protein
MMKKFFFFLFSFSFLVQANAFAVVSGSFEQAYTVASDNSTTEVTSFDIDGAAPWLYLRLPASPHASGNSSVDSHWFFNPEVSEQFASGDPGDTDLQRDFWLPSDLVWDSNKAVGDWHIDASFFWNGPGTGANDVIGNQTVNFTVTPEPVSVALFGMGAGALGLTRLRRKKK